MQLPVDLAAPAKISWAGVLDKKQEHQQIVIIDLKQMAMQCVVNIYKDSRCNSVHSDCCYIPSL